MENLAEECVDSSCELAKVPKSSLKEVLTPFLDESKDPEAMGILVERDISQDCKTIRIYREIETSRSNSWENKSELQDKRGRT